ncbi:hypothetical protein SSCG_04970 [Streptomyces clavuligerus]|nr:hypothetical protein SSCG_04970 [Streptomyces clavuligerus]
MFYNPGYGLSLAATVQQPFGQQPGFGHPEPVAQGFAPGYEQQSWPGYPQDPYAGYPQQGYEQPHEQGHEQPHAPGPHAGGASGYPYPDASGAQLPSQPDRQHQRQQGPALDETSFFDTGMIDLDQLRRYEQGR